MPHRTLIALALVTIALGTLGGCTIMQTASPPGDALTTTADDEGAVEAYTRAERSTSLVSSGGAERYDRAAETDVAAPGGLKRVGLYGELGPNVRGSDPSDGFMNIQRVTFTPEGWDWDPEVDRTGRRLVFSSTMHNRNPDIYLQNIGGRTVTQLTNDPSRDVMPTFSPDSERVAFASDRGGNFDIYIMSIDGGKVVQITSDAGHEMHPSWSPDGNLLAYCKLGETSGKWEIWVVDLRTYTRHFVEWGLFPQWCPDITVPKILIQRGQQRGKRYYSVWTVDFINGEALHPTQIVSSDAAAVMNPAWGPDGTRIVFTTVTETADDPEQADLWVVNLDGTGQTNLTNGLYANFVPTWSPDGTIYFVSNRSGIDNIWALQPDRALTLTRSDRPGVASGPASTTTGVATAPTD